jgi:acyl-CoA thioesterase-1
MKRLSVLIVMFVGLLAQAAAAQPVKIVALGDSLTAGYGLGAGDGFTDRLQARLKADGLEATVVNAGVSGDTSKGGLARLDWSVPDDTTLVILELGANDALRGIEPAQTRANLDAMLTRLKARKITCVAGRHDRAAQHGRGLWQGVQPDLWGAGAQA